MQLACVADSRMGWVEGSCEHSVCSGLVWLTQDWVRWGDVVNTVYAVGLCGWLKNGTGGGKL